MAADGFARDRHRLRTFEKHVLPLRVRLRRGENRLFPDHAFGPRCVGGVAAQVNSAGGCRNCRQGRGFACGVRSLRRSFRLDWRVAVHAEQRRWLAGADLSPAPLRYRTLSSPRAGPRSARGELRVR